MREKIVLVDFWATTCASCIQAMPRIHDVYIGYRDRGFEVVSVALDGKARRRQVLRIKAEQGLTWTTVVGDDVREAIFDVYGLSGVPQYMLLDRDGRLYASTTEIDNGRNLEALLDEMLAAEAAEKVATTVH